VDGVAMNPGLEVQGVTVRFGGLVAVNDVSLQAPMGRITGLIGPNGAGKSTTFNACTGLVTPAAGTVRMFGEEVTRLSPSARGQRGLARTFQRINLYGSLTVRENVSLGREAALAGRGLLRQLLATRSERSQTSEAAEREITRCGLEQLADEPVARLSTGQRRLVELPRALASGIPLLLRDEPTTGHVGTETHRFGEVLVEVMHERDMAILLVEHDMALVRAICEWLYVLDFGELIHEGPMDEVLASAVVRDAYLGAEAG
jgi:ABC-type branched-subunit amino acid transport system ATPase component